jgi:hypothetical protein
MKFHFFWYSRGKCIVFNSRIIIGRFQHSPTARVGIFILLNNTLVEECTFFVILTK